MRSRKRSRPQAQRSKLNKTNQIWALSQHKICCRGAGSIIGLQPTTVRQTYFYPGANKANHINGYETEVVDLTGHRFGGIFALFAHPRTGKSACVGPRLLEPV
jgi:hypothetical protein